MVFGTILVARDGIRMGSCVSRRTLEISAIGCRRSATSYFNVIGNQARRSLRTSSARCADGQTQLYPGSCDRRVPPERSKEVDVALKASLASQSDWQEFNNKELLEDCSDPVLGIIARSFGTAEINSDSRELLIKVVEQMFERSINHKVHLRHILPLLASFDGEGIDGFVENVLALASKALELQPEHNLPLSDVVPALEGLARIRYHRHQDNISEKSSDIAIGILALSGGASSILLEIIGAKTPRDRATAFRFLAAVQTFPEVFRRPGFAVAMSRVHGMRWPRGLPEGLSETQIAAAACQISRFGGWQSARCSWLLSRAMARQTKHSENQAEADQTEKKTENQPYLSAEAQSYWMCAIAHADGLLESEADGKLAEDAIKSFISNFEANKEVPLARMLWSIYALGKDSSDPEKTEELYNSLNTNPEKFSKEVWPYLIEVDASRNSAKQDSEEAPTTEDATQKLVRDAQNAQSEFFRLSPLGKEIYSQLMLAVEASGEDVSGKEVAPDVGSYTVLASLEHGDSRVAFDFDVYESPVGRVLRRKHWEAEANDVRIIELNYAAWSNLGNIDRAKLIRRRLRGEPDPLMDDDSEE